MASTKEKRFKEDSKYRIYRILHLAKKYRWSIRSNDGEKCDFINKEGSILCINYIYLKVSTALHHPKWGNTVLERNGELTEKNIESIFRNPRAHMPETVKSQYVK